MAFPHVSARRHIQPNIIDLNAMTEIHTVGENHRLSSDFHPQAQNSPLHKWINKLKNKMSFIIEVKI